MNKAKAATFMALLVAVSVVIGLTILEVGYRAFRFVGEQLGFVEESVVPAEVGRFDPELGWALQPNSRAVSNRVGRIEYVINSKGLRDDEHDYAKLADVRRIVIVGDSRTFGFGAPLENHFTRLIEGYCPSTEVINMGVSGFGVDQELLFLEQEGLKYDPDLVIAYVAHFGNHRHMHANRFRASKPKFDLQDGQLVLTNRPEVPDDPIYSFSLVLTEIFDKLGGLRRGAAPDRGDIDAANAKNDDFMHELYRLAVAIIDRMRASAENHGAQFLLVTHIDKLQALTAGHGIDVLNVQLALKNPYFSLPDGLRHINESGNGVLAWEIVRGIRALQSQTPEMPSIC